MTWALGAEPGDRQMGHTWVPAPSHPQEPCHHPHPATQTERPVLLNCQGPLVSLGWGREARPCGEDCGSQDIWDSSLLYPLQLRLSSWSSL